MNMSFSKVCYKHLFKNSLFWKNSFKVLRHNDITLPLNLNNKSLMHTSAIAMAGHSKWANIKHTKGLKDQEKAKTFSKFVQLMKIAVKAGGGIDPKLNSKLAKVIEQSQKSNMPMSTIEATLKRFEKQAENSKPGSLNMVSPSRLTISIDVFTDNITRTKNELKSICKKIGFKEQKINLSNVFEEKGIVVAKSKEDDINKAVDDAIEAGAEEVTEEDGMLTFVCEPLEFYKVRNEIEKMKYDIEYADVEKFPHSLISPNEEQSEKLKVMLSRLEDHDEVVKVACNFEL